MPRGIPDQNWWAFTCTALATALLTVGVGWLTIARTACSEDDVRNLITNSPDQVRKSQQIEFIAAEIPAIRQEHKEAVVEQRRDVHDLEEKIEQLRVDVGRLTERLIDGGAGKPARAEARQQAAKES